MESEIEAGRRVGRDSGCRAVGAGRARENDGSLDDGGKRREELAVGDWTHLIGLGAPGLLFLVNSRLQGGRNAGIRHNQ